MSGIVLASGVVRGRRGESWQGQHMISCVSIARNQIHPCHLALSLFGSIVERCANVVVLFTFGNAPMELA